VEWEKFRPTVSSTRPGAENYLDVVNRLRPFVGSLLQNHQGQEILIVGTGCQSDAARAASDYPLEEAVRSNSRTIASMSFKGTKDIPSLTSRQ